ncbi:unnamed protein product [Microthlaspi erraticum]|uniref:Uncharacterized protein n=1 Tax=Microthlaspi erraticum TaxID=1685480 RepID=A0A6D2HNM9_9BRAS|nr:unnamed protein product [Microthlaspi erraticum]
MLKDDGDSWVTDGQELENFAIGYYKRLYSLDDVEENVEKLSPEGFTTLTHEEITDHNKDNGEPSQGDREADWTNPSKFHSGPAKHGQHSGTARSGTLHETKKGMRGWMLLKLDLG